MIGKGNRNTIMSMFVRHSTSRTLLATALLATASFALPAPAEAAESEPAIPRSEWTFSGVTGHFDKAQLQRGFQVYKEVCAACHSVRLLKYRNLMEPGGPGFTEGQVKALAEEAEVIDGFTDAGEPAKRKGRPADAFKMPFPNEAAARAANNGALPPDLSLMAFARNAPTEPGFEPLQWAKDIVAGYQEGGTDYTNMLLQGYEEAAPAYALENGHYKLLAAADVKPDSVRCASISKNEEGKETCNPLNDGLYYNKYFPGHQIAMPAPLSDGSVTYTDGTPTTKAQLAQDVSAFLMWAADPKMEERKGVGIRVLIYLLILAGLLYFAKRQIWARIGQH
jgi:cytochrome c1